MSAIIVLDSSDEEEVPRKRTLLSRSIPATITPIKRITQTGGASKALPKTRTIPSSITVTRHSPVTTSGNCGGTSSVGAANVRNSPVLSNVLLSQAAAKPKLPALTKISTVFPRSLHVASPTMQQKPEQPLAAAKPLPQLPKLVPSPHVRKRKTPTPPQTEPQLHLQLQQQLQMQQQQTQQLQQQQQRTQQLQQQQQRTQLQQQQEKIKQLQQQQHQQMQQLQLKILKNQKKQPPKKQLPQPQTVQLPQSQPHTAQQPKNVPQQPPQAQQQKQQQPQPQSQLQQRLEQQHSQKANPMQSRKPTATPPSTVTSASTLMPMIASVQSMAAGATPPLQLLATPPHVATSLYDHLPQSTTITPQYVNSPIIFNSSNNNKSTNNINNTNNNNNNYNNNNNNNNKCYSHNNNNQNYNIHLPPKRTAVSAASPRATPSPASVRHTPPPPLSLVTTMPALSAKPPTSNAAEKSVRRIKPTTLLRPSDDAWLQRFRTNDTLLGDDDVIMELVRTPSTSAAAKPKARASVSKTQSCLAPSSVVTTIVVDVGSEKPTFPPRPPSTNIDLTVTKVNGALSSKIRLQDQVISLDDSFTSTSSNHVSPNSSVTTILDDDESEKELLIPSTKEKSKQPTPPPAPASTTAPTQPPAQLEPYYLELLEVCRAAEASLDMERLIESKLLKYYHEVHPDFVKSRGFRKNVQHTMTQIRDNPKLVYCHLKTIIEELKARRKGYVVTEPNKEAAPSATSTGNKRTDEQIKKLNNALYVVTKRIQKLEEADVDWDDDDENSAYLQNERFKKRACQIYEKICDLTGESKNAHRQMKKPIQFNDTPYPQFNKTLQAFVNRTKEFPDYYDVLRMLEHCNTQYVYGLVSFEMKRLAHDAFTKVGKLLQSRRKTDLYETVTHYTANAKDPATTDPALLAKLSENQKNQRKISDIIEQFAREQDMCSEELRMARQLEKEKMRDRPSGSGCSIDDGKHNVGVHNDGHDDDHVNNCQVKSDKGKAHAKTFHTAMACLENGRKSSDGLSGAEETTSSALTTTTAAAAIFSSIDGGDSEKPIAVKSETETTATVVVADAPKLSQARIPNADGTPAAGSDETKAVCKNPKPCDKTQDVQSVPTAAAIVVIADNDDKRDVNNINCRSNSNSRNNNNNNIYNNNNNVNTITRAKTDNSVQAIDTRTITTPTMPTTSIVAAAPKTTQITTTATTARRNDTKPMAIVNGRLQPITMVSRAPKSPTQHMPTIVATTTTGTGLKIVSVSSLNDKWHKNSDTSDILHDGPAIADDVASADQVVIVGVGANNAKQKLLAAQSPKPKQPNAIAAEIVISDEDSQSFFPDCYC